MTNLDKLLKEFKEAEIGAIKVEVLDGMRNSNPESDLVYFIIGEPLTSEQANEEKRFVELASNNSSKLIKIIEVMRSCLEKYEKSAFEINGEIYKVGNKATEALQQAEKIAGEI